MMKSLRSLYTGIALATTLLANDAVQAAITSHAVTQTKNFSVQIPFIENRGQLPNSEVAYYTTTFGGSLFVKHTGEWIYNLPTRRASETEETWAFQERLLNAADSRPVAQLPSASKISYFKGQADNWHSNIASYGNVAFKDVYPGISLHLQAQGNNIEKLFYVAPNADASQIQLQIDGVNRLSINDQEQLVLKTDLGNINFTAPKAFQFINGERIPVDVAYVTNANQYGFKLGQYDKSRELVIDPLLASTFIGGDNTNAISDFERIHDVVERDGFIFVAGMTDSSNFPTALGYNNNYTGGFYDGFISKFNADLSTLVASTFIGGSAGDDIYGMALDDVGSVYVVGRTSGSGFPLTAGGYRYNASVTGGTFVAKLSNDLSSLSATALAAGSSLPADITIGNNSVYISGRTNSPSVPVTPGAYDTTCGGDGACDPSGSFGITNYYGYAERLTTDLSSLLAATYLGESGGASIKVASNTDVYTITLSKVTETRIGGLDANLSTLFGTVSYPLNNNFKSLAVGDTFVVAAGSSRDPDLPTTANAYDTGCGTDNACDPTGSTNYLTADIFVGKYSLDLQTTQALTYFGGSGTESVNDVVIDVAGNIIITGSVESTDLPTTSYAHSSAPNGASDGFIAKFDTDLSSLGYSSYFGGGSDDSALSAYATGNGQVYVAGSTDSADFPTNTGAFDQSFNGGDLDAFVSLFDTAGTGGGGGDNVSPVADAGSDKTVSPRATVYLDGQASADPDGVISTYQWSQISGKAVSLRNADTAIARFRAPGVKKGRTKVLVFELTVTDNQGASSSDQVTVTVSKSLFLLN